MHVSPSPEQQAEAAEPLPARECRPLAARVVVVGGGFGGLRTARALRGAPVEITIIDQRNYHLFQPLLYRVATAGLSPAEIAAPIRSILAGRRRGPGVAVLLGEVIGVDTARRTRALPDLASPFSRRLEPLSSGEPVRPA